MAAGYSSYRRQRTTFAGKENLPVKYSIAIYQIGTGAATIDGLRGSSGVANQTSCARLNLIDQYGYTVAGASTQNPFLSPEPDLLTSSFTRFRATSLRFRYEPQSGTDTQEQSVFAFAADPAHPLINTTSGTQAKLLSVADSIPFAPWRAWELDVSRSLDKNVWLWTSDLLTAGSTTNDQLERLNALGCIGCIASIAGTAGTGDVFGVLYMDITVEYKEFCPISVTRPSLIWNLVRKSLIHSPDFKRHWEERYGSGGGPHLGEFLGNELPRKGSPDRGAVTLPSDIGEKEEEVVSAEETELECSLMKEYLGLRSKYKPLSSSMQGQLESALDASGLLPVLKMYIFQSAFSRGDDARGRVAQRVLRYFADQLSAMLHPPTPLSE